MNGTKIVKELIVTVAFNVKSPRSVGYWATKDIDRAVKRFRTCLEDDNVQFLSVRKVK